MMGTAYRWGFVCVVGLFMVAPTAVVYVISFSSGTILFFPPPGYSLRWYIHLFNTPTWTSAATTSLEVGVLVTVLATTLGTVTALGIDRGRFPGRGLVSVLLLSPIIVPVIVVALGVYLVALQTQLVGTVLGLVLAHTALALPYVIVNVAASLRTMNRTVELASTSCGAGPIRTFYKVTLPEIWPGVVAGALFAFITSWDEAVISFYMSSPLLQTLPVVIWQQVRQDVDPTVAAAASLVTTVSFTLLFVFLFVQVRRGRGHSVPSAETNA